MILANDPHAVAEYVIPRLPYQWELKGDFAAFGSVRNDRIVGGVLFHSYRAPGDMEVMMAGEPGWLTRAMLRTMFDFAFNKMGCIRVTAVTSKKNRKARALERMGWVMEGKLRKAMPDGSDAIVYGMLRRECQWIEGLSHGNV